MRSLIVLALVTLTGCGAQFTPETLIDSLRVLSITANPPEVAPGETSELAVAFSDPSRLGLPNTIIWVGCEPDPLDLNRSACNDASILIRPTLITDYPPGLKLLGFAQTAKYSAAAETFNVLAPEDPIRRNGSVGQVIAIVLGEEISITATGKELEDIFSRIEKKEIPTAIALTRVLVSEKTERNHNPEITALTFDGQRLPEGARLQVKPGQHVALGVAVPETSWEKYFEQLPSGPVEKEETVVGAWYSIGGRFSRERFDARDTQGSTFIAPGSTEFPEDPVPEKRLGQLWLVIRDNRGAQAYEQFRYYVCDESLPSPTVRSITPSTGPNDPVVVTGENIARTLDIVIGDVALTSGTYSAGRGAFVGYLPSLPSGTYPVRVRGQNCSNADTGLTYTVP